MDSCELFSRRINLTEGTIEGAQTSIRHLSDLEGYYADEQSYRAALRMDDPIVYFVSTEEYNQGEGQLHCGLGTLMPGKIGKEYFMTRGHLHLWRPAAEIYYGLKGRGCLLLENMDNHKACLLTLAPGQLAYVPRNTAHRAINTGKKPLKYIGFYPAQAGHDYETILKSNFRYLVVQMRGKPLLVERSKYINSLQQAIVTG
jgi:glucose-6-phosphate isomerase, archaeal